MLIVNGPVRDQLGINYLENIFGPGDRANATIGRALRLIILNVLGIRPHEFDQSTQGTPAKYGCCIGENEEDSPWEPLHVERGFAPDASTVTMQMVRSDLHVEHRSTQAPEEILNTIADSMSYAGGIYEAPPYNRNNGCAVVMGPEHANIIAGKGWTKQAVRAVPLGALRQDEAASSGASARSSAWRTSRTTPSSTAPKAADLVILVVAGARQRRRLHRLPQLLPRRHPHAPQRHGRDQAALAPSPLALSPGFASVCSDRKGASRSCSRTPTASSPPTSAAWRGRTTSWT